MEQVNGVLLGMLLASFGVLVPITFVAGVVLTHKVAGPIHRMQVFLNQTLRGAKPADCRLRESDELQEFCALINQVTAPMRQRETAGPAAALPGRSEVQNAA